MATRQEAIDANTQHFAEVRKQFPEADTHKLETFAALQERNIHFHFDVNETLGDGTWQKMNSVLSKQPELDVKAALAEARTYLDGHEDLQARFDVIFENVNEGTAAAAQEMMAKHKPAV